MVSKYEIRAKKELEAAGWRVDDKRGMARWSKNRDFFNLFDLVAVKKGQPMRWISIKGLAGAPKAHREEVQDFWLPKGNVKEIWWKSKGRMSPYWKTLIFK